MYSYIKFTLLFILITDSAMSQADLATNSFEESYKQSNPTLKYQYDSASQTHDYSNNWDLDSDGKPDQVYFVGMGGVHLYYYLRIVLSTDHVTRNYRFIQSDLPILPDAEALKNNEFSPLKNQAFFAVFDKDQDNQNELFVRLDNATFTENRKALKQKGINTPFVVITCKKGKIVFSNYTDQ